MSAGRAAPRGRYASWGKAGELRNSPTTLGILEHEGNSGEGAESKPPWASGFFEIKGVPTASFFLTLNKINDRVSTPTTTERSRARAARCSSS